MTDAGTPYSFVTVWRVEAPIDPVWEAIYDAEAYPSWWKAVLSVTRLEDGSPDGIVAIELAEPVRAFVAGFPIRLKILAVSLEDPDGFLGTLGAPAAPG